MRSNGSRLVGALTGVTFIMALWSVGGCSEKGVMGQLCDPSAPESCPSGYFCVWYGPQWQCHDQLIGTCGNGVVEPGEQCDGTDFAGAACADFGFPAGTQVCSTLCTVLCPMCGNGVVDPGEECDDGNASNEDDCPSGAGGTCQNPRCGDGFLWAGNEECDDGNTNVNDDCPSGPDGTCQPASCGDGYLWTQGSGTEECDCGATSSSPAYNQPQCLGSNSDTEAGACRATLGGGCYWAICGDGVVDPGEECDNGGANADTVVDACRTNCNNAHCGDGVIDSGEMCDDANQLNGDGCSQDCLSQEICGNGIVDVGEGCDDGNGNNDDFCPDGVLGTCQPAACGDGHVWTQGGTETCDDGNSSNGDACPDDTANGGLCQAAVCGDGFLWAGQETCDDGNTVDGDGCNATCQGAGICGDGVLDPGLAEVCDGSDFGSLTCLTFGYVGGSLICDVTCAQIDLSNCIP